MSSETEYKKRQNKYLSTTKKGCKLDEVTGSRGVCIQPS